ncbi:MAG: hypothetical protein K9H16_03415 [Bacteroidales bacterium]|nr:hypothetical protein [Bacteroidales bacterium]
MIRKYLILFFSILSLNPLIAINGNVPEGARSSAMGGASVALSDFWSLQNNQAGLAFYNLPAAGAYLENRYLIKELSLKSGGVVLPTKSGVFGLKLSYFGYSLYNESKFGLAFARKLNEKFAVGVQLDYLLTSIGNDYGKKGMVTFEVGFLSRINDHLSLGAHIFNPINAKITDYADERVPAVIRVGASYAFNDQLMVTAEVEKDSEFDPQARLGIEYRIIEEIYVRGGIASNPGLYSFGFGLNLKKLKLDFSSTVHQELGYSPQISMIYRFK